MRYQFKVLWPLFKDFAYEGSLEAELDRLGNFGYQVVGMTRERIILQKQIVEFPEEGKKA